MSSTPRPTVGIIGAGIAGLATAIRLANKGYSVSVFEANGYPGGKLTEFEQDGYRFDAGPSLFTMPQLVEELFTLSKVPAEGHFDYIKLNTICHYFYEDGTQLKAHADPEAFTKEASAVMQEPEENIRKALANSAYLHKYLGNLFMFRSLHKLGTWFNKEALRSYLRLHRFNFFSTMAQANKRRFNNPKLSQLFNRYATYNGSNPYQTPATLNIIPHLEFGIGAFFPKQGMHGITQSLYTLALQLGVNFHFNAKVQRILVEGKTAKGIAVDGQQHLFNKVVSNMDVVNTYRKLMADQKPPKRLLNQPKSSSALIFYWGITKEFLELDLHNIFFSEDYNAEFKHIFEQKTLYHDPTVYINITSKHKSNDAPKGCENWFVMINVPNNEGQDWDSAIAQARQYIIAKLSRMLGQDMQALIANESILDPRLIESRTSSSQGALYGNSSNNRYAAFLRHANFSRRIQNLYFCGGSVHPGGGIPLCLSSAKIVSQVIDE